MSSAAVVIGALRVKEEWVCLNLKTTESDVYNREDKWVSIKMFKYHKTSTYCDR